MGEGGKEESEEKEIGHWLLMECGLFILLKEVRKVAKNKKQMPVKGVYIYGTPTGQPKSTSVIRYGSDLRDGGGKRKK